MKLLIILFGISLLSLSVVEAENNDYAIIVGVSKYNYLTDAEHLLFCAKDANDFAAFIKSPEGGEFPTDHVTILTDDDATKANFYKTLGILAKIKQVEHLYIYFSGHCLQSPIENRFFAFRDVRREDLDVETDAIDIPTFFSKIRDCMARAHKIVFFIDSCHSGALGQGSKGDSDPEMVAAMKAAWDKDSKKRGGNVCMAFLSSQANQNSFESKNLKSGVFTHFLLEGLRGAAANTEGRVYAGELANYVTGHVSAYITEAKLGIQYPGTTPNFPPDLLLAVKSGALQAVKEPPMETVVQPLPSAQPSPIAPKPEIPEEITQKQQQTSVRNEPQSAPTVDDDEKTIMTGENLDYYISATDSPTYYEVRGLPSGLRIDHDEGRIYGRASTAGVYSISMFAENSKGRGSARLKLRVEQPEETEQPQPTNVPLPQGFQVQQPVAVPVQQVIVFAVANNRFTLGSDDKIRNQWGQIVGEKWAAAFPNSLAQLHFYTNGCFQLMIDGKIFAVQTVLRQTRWTQVGMLLSR